MGDFSKPVRILSLDGGGIRGISSLLILERIMERIRDVHQLDNVPRPCDYFDLIGGTSTGGIIAIMLGRLGMTVDECIRAYRNVAQQAFTPKRGFRLPLSPSGAFSAQSLEDAIKRIVREFCTDMACVSRRRGGYSTVASCPHSDLAFCDQACTKTVVLAITKANIDAPPTLFKTYDTSAAFDECSIWQVARATSATTTYFRSIKVGRDGIEFINAGFGYNNPCDELIKEAQLVFGKDREPQVLSIGTGLGPEVSIKDTRLSLLNALKNMSTTPNRVAARLEHQYGGSGQYFRFNVDRGLEHIAISDWAQAGNIAAHTRNYLSEQSKAIDELINDFTEGALSANRRDIHATLSKPHYYETPRPNYVIPFITNFHFTGREDTLDILKKKLSAQKGTTRVALYGLGGVGKTQLALQLSYWAKEYMPGYSIFWVPALSEGSFKQAYSEIQKQLAIGTGANADNKEALEQVQQYLSSDASGQWLLVVDNADDFGLFFGSKDNPGSLCKYLPTSSYGLILLTTRSRRVAAEFGQSDILELQKMKWEEATACFTRIVKEDLVCNQETTSQLLEELNWLPLAITQAAAYINSSDMPTSRYLELMHSTEKDRMNLISRNFHDSTRYPGLPNAVGTTLLVSFNELKDSDPNAAELLTYIAYIEPKSIPRSILPPQESQEEMEFAIGTLSAYGFVTKEDGDGMFDMHPLIQLSARLWVQNEGRALQAIVSATQHMEKLFRSIDYNKPNSWRPYLPHARALLRRTETQGMDERYNLLGGVGGCLLADGRAKEAVECFEEKLAWEESHYDEEHPCRLVSQYGLAYAYEKAGNKRQATELLGHLVKVDRRALDEEYPDQPVAQQQLASVYLFDGKNRQAVKLPHHLDKVEEKTSDEGHLHWLYSQGEFPKTHILNGKKEQAVRVLEDVVTMQKGILDERHPDRLDPQHELACVTRY